MRFVHRQSLLTLCITAAALCACERTQEVQVVAQDYRFLPSFVRLQAERPFTLAIRNEGHEPHEFTSPLLTAQNVHVIASTSQVDHPGASLRVLPGKELLVTIEAPAGTYGFRCKIRGHAGMTGTIVLE